MAFNKTETRTALGLAGVFAGRMTGLFMIMPVFALYGSDLEGFTPFLMGLAIGIYGLTQASLQIPFGLLSDRIGRKPVIYGGLVLFALGSVMAAWSQSIGWVIAGRALQGAGAISSAMMALAADLSRDQERPKVMAVIGIIIGLSFTVSLILGPIIAGAWQLKGIFLFSAVTALLSMLLIHSVVPNVVNKAQGTEALTHIGQLSSVIRHSQLWRLNIGVFVIHMCMAALFTFLPVKLVEAGLAKEHLWHLLLPAVLLSFVMIGPMMRFNRKQKVKQGLQLGVMLMLISLALVAGAQTQWMLGLVVICFFSGFNYIEATLPSQLALVAPAGRKGAAMGVFASCQFLGAFAGGAIAGALLQWWDISIVLSVMGAILLLWLAVSAGLENRANLVAVHLPVGEAEPAFIEQQLEPLASLGGVVESVWIPEEGMIYLKVINDEFDLNAAKHLLVASGVEE